MFDLNESKIRRLATAWLPPEGYSFARVFATTYSLQENVLGELALNFLPETARRGTRESTIHDLRHVLHTGLNGKLLVLYDCSALDKKGEYANSNYGLFGPFISGMPLQQRSNGISRFHPKLFWATFKEDSSGRCDRARLMVSSKNLSLALDHMEGAIVFDFQVPSTKAEKKAQLDSRKSIAGLAKLVRPWTRSKLLDNILRETIQLYSPQLAQSARDVDFMIPNAKCTPIDLALKNNPSELIITSPFLQKRTLGSLQNRLSKKKCKTVILTNQNTLDDLAPEDVNKRTLDPFPNLKFATLAALGSPNKNRSRQTLHAKIFVANSPTGSTLCLGSSNFTFGGLVRNRELNVVVTQKDKIKIPQSLWKNAKSFNDPELFARPGLSLEDVDLTREQLIVEWISTWTVVWKRRLAKNGLTSLPLVIVPTLPPQNLKNRARRMKVSVRSGQAVSKAEVIATRQLELAAAASFSLEELEPLIEVRIGNITHWLMPDYSRFPNKASYEQMHFDELTDALELLFRPSAYKRKPKGDKTGSGRGTGSKDYAGVDLERLIVSFLREGLPSQITREVCLQRAKEIHELIRRTKDSKQHVAQKKLIDSLIAIERALKENAS